jgi:hypothetical protein
MFKTLAAVLVPFLLATSAVQAADYKIEFSLPGFQAPEPGIGPAPFDSAVGSLIFSAPSPSTDWSALKAFDMTIGDVTYSLQDVGFENYGWNTTVVGNLNPQDGLHFGTNDFAFSLWHEEQVVYAFYTSEAASGVWAVSHRPVVITEITASAVPEVQTTAMLLAGLGLLGAAARRRKAAR